MSETDDLEATLAETFESTLGADEDLTTDAAAKAAAFLEEYELEQSDEEIVKSVEAAPYDTFTHRFDYVIGDLAASVEDCTDSREFRLAGYGDLAADPTQGA